MLGDGRLAKMTPSTPARAPEAELERLRHDLRTPLSTVIGFGLLLQRSAEGALNPEQALYLRKLNQGCQQLLAVVNHTSDTDPGKSSV